MKSEKIPPWYFNRILLDAGTNAYDLSYLEGGHIVSGRFGNALDVSPERTGALNDLPTNFATIARLNAVYIGGDVDTPEGTIWNRFGYTRRPEAIDATLGADKWTWDFWLRLRTIGDTETVLLALKTGFNIDARQSTGGGEIGLYAEPRH